MGKKKKHIYSDSLKNGLDIQIKEEYNVDLHNPIRQLQALYQIRNNVWTEYISEIVYDNIEPRREDIWEDVSYLLNEINDSFVTREIISKLVQDEYFDPYEDIFPYYLFDDNIAYRVKKKSEFLKKYARTSDAFLFKNLNILFVYNNNRINLANYLSVFDVVILFNSHSTIFAISKDSREYFNLQRLHDEFNEIEPNKWEMNKQKTMLYVKNGNVSKIHLFDNRDLLNDCLATITLKGFDNAENRQKEKIKSFICKKQDIFSEEYDINELFEQLGLN